MDEPAAIRTEGLSKYYGSVTGVVDLGLTVGSGTIFGFLGPNGAGKTTTIRLLLDFIRPSAGTARLFGMDSRRERLAICRRVGYMPSEPVFYPEQNPRQFLRFSAKLRGAVADAAIEALAERLSLGLGRPIAELSRGDRVKTALIRALMHQPDLLILDEPSTGLDPLAQHELYAILDEVRGDGRSVFLSSHVLPEVERLCDRVGIIRAGRLVTVASVTELKNRVLRRFEITFAGGVDAAPFALLSGVETCEARGHRLRLSVTGPIDEVIKAAARHEVVDFTAAEVSLEEAFLPYYRTAGRPLDA